MQKSGNRAGLNWSASRTTPSLEAGQILAALGLLAQKAMAAMPPSDAVAHVDDATHSPFELVSALFVFMLASFVGLEVIRRVSRLLHTPLMSLTNAISAISVVGAILVAGPAHPSLIHWLGLLALTASVTNIVSGFLITDRMLKLFKKKEPTNSK
jgi:proton-translocating NAD(P)+ transhydrogenase subunit alpha